MKKAYGKMMTVTTLGRIDDSKMSVEELPLGACLHKIRPKNFRRTKLIKHSSGLLFYI